MIGDGGGASGRCTSGPDGTGIGWVTGGVGETCGLTLGAGAVMDGVGCGVDGVIGKTIRKRNLMNYLQVMVKRSFISGLKTKWVI